MENTFIISWDSIGLDAIIQIDNSLYDNEILERLCDTFDSRNSYTSKLSSIIRGLILRANFNPQRNYEIYSITSCDLDETALKLMFATSPQIIVDAIREKGHKILSMRDTLNRVIK